MKSATFGTKFLGSIFFLATLCIPQVVSIVSAQTVIVSVSSPYMQNGEVVVSRAGDDCESVAMSAGGRYVAFATETNLDPDSKAQGNGRVTMQVYVHDRDLDGNGVYDEEGIGKTKTVIVSISTPDKDGKTLRGNAGSGLFGVAISASGRYIAFESRATNLVAPATTARRSHIYVHDRDADGNGVFDEDGAGKTRTFLLDITKDGKEGNASSLHPSMDYNGTKVAFDSTATDLANNKLDDERDVFLRDWLGQRTYLLSRPAKVGEPRGPSSNPAVSYDGRLVAFESMEKNLVAPPANGKKQIFLVEVLSGQVLAVVSKSPKGEFGDKSSFNAAASGFGSVIAFMSDATNLFAGANGRTQTLRATLSRDDPKFLISLVSAEKRGFAGNGDSAPGILRDRGTDYSFRGVSLSNDGTRVAFASAATNLVDRDTNGKVDVFVRDITKGKTVRASVSSEGGQGDNHSGYAGGTVISRDGRWVAFESKATNLVTPGTDGTREVFVHGLQKAFAADSEDEDAP